MSDCILSLCILAQLYCTVYICLAHLNLRALVSCLIVSCPYCILAQLYCTVYICLAHLYLRPLVSCLVESQFAGTEVGL